MVIVDIGTKSTLAMYGLFQAGDVTARAKIPEPVAASHMARAYKTEKAQAPRSVTSAGGTPLGGKSLNTEAQGAGAVMTGSLVSTGDAASRGVMEDHVPTAPTVVPTITPEAVSANAFIGVPHYMFYKKWRSFAKRDPYMAVHIANADLAIQTKEALRAALRPVYTAVGARDWHRAAQGVDSVLSQFGANMLDAAKGTPIDSL